MQQYVVGWFGLALINAALANIDRRSPLKYFLVSLGLGPVVTLVIAGSREQGGAMRQIDVWKGRREA